METWEITFIVAAMVMGFIAETLAHHTDTGGTRVFVTMLFSMASILVIISVWGMIGEDAKDFFNENFDVFGKIAAQLKPR